MRRMIPALMFLAIAMPAFAAGKQQAAGSEPAKQFVMDAIKGDNSEIMLGQLAQEKGASEGVRQFGQTLVNDHRMAKQDMMKLADTLKVTPTSEMSADAQKTYDRLSKLSGKAFDRQFVKDMVADHRKDIAKFQKEANARNAASEVAQMQLPTLKKHLSLAQSLEKQV